jgi:hypothetical protein
VRWRKDQKRVDRRKLKAVVDGREKAEAAAKLAAEKRRSSSWRGCRLGWRTS